MSQLDDLREMRLGLKSRLLECKSDQNYAVLVRELRTVNDQIEQLDPQPVKRKETPLDEFSKRLQQRRRAEAQDPGRPAADGNMG